MVEYVLTGATGELGSRILQHLLKSVPSNEIRVSLHNPNGPSELIRNFGVEIREGNYHNPDTLFTSFSGANKLFLVSYPSMALERADLHKAAIDAAVRAGVKHIFYTSLSHPDDSVSAVMASHFITEKHLMESGVTYTILRETIYSEMWPLWMGLADLDVFKGEGPLTVPIPIGDGSIAWASHEDLALGIAKILAAPSGYENRIVNLTGLEVASIGDILGIISKIINRPIALQIVPEDLFVEHQKKIRNMPESTIRVATSSYRALTRGELARPDPLLKELVGGELKSLESTVKAYLAGTEQYKHVPS